MIAVGGLLVYALYFYALIKLIPITLTLPGIAGLILTIGVAADANIVIFERVKEEIRAGRSIRQGIAIGYRKGLDGDHRRERRHDHDRVHPVRARDRRSPGIRAHARDRHVRVAVHGGDGDPGDPLDDGPLEDDLAARRCSARVARNGSGGSTSWGASRYFFTMSGVILLIGALAIGGRGLNLGIDFTSGTRITASLVQTRHPAAGHLRGQLRPVRPAPRFSRSPTRRSATTSSRSRPSSSSRRARRRCGARCSAASGCARLTTRPRSARRSGRPSPTAP